MAEGGTFMCHRKSYKTSDWEVCCEVSVGLLSHRFVHEIPYDSQENCKMQKDKGIVYSSKYPLILSLESN